jgi:hypothetical protein
MEILNRRAQARILDTLRHCYFTEAAYEVTFPTNGAKCVVIRFKDNPEFSFEIHKSKSNQYAVSLCPGDHTNNETHTDKEFHQCVYLILDWDKNIKSELRAIHSEQVFDEIKEMVDKIVNEKYQDIKEKFSQEEIESLRANLDEMAKKINDLCSENLATKEEIKTINETIDELKEDVAHFPKRTWYRTAATRLFTQLNKIINSPAGQAIIKAETLKLLGHTS